MGKIKGTDHPPRGRRALEELEERTVRTPKSAPSTVDVHQRDEGQSRSGLQGAAAPSAPAFDLVPPERQGGGREEPDLLEGAGPGFFKRLDDKVDALIGKVAEPRFRPGEDIGLLKEWEAVAPLGTASALAAIARCGEKRRYPLLAHLIGLGGKFEVSERGSKEVVSLEGLYTKDSRLLLPPVFHQISQGIRAMLLAQLEEGEAATEIEEVFRPVENAWAKECGWGEFGRMLKREGSPAEAPKLVCVRAGWQYPTGHAAGLVYAQEGERHVLYACNPGQAGKLERSIQKFEIVDMTRFSSYLERTSHVPDATREIWYGDPAVLGLVSAPKGEQIPDEFSKGRQKRGNCPVASRKSCQLAMLWSGGIQHGMSEKGIKTFYKMTTTAIRIEGVGLALEDGNPEFLSRVLVALISKWDRPDCRRLAYRVADQLTELHGALPVSEGVTDFVTHKALGESPYVEVIRLAVRLCNLDLKAKDSNGMSLLKYAKASNNNEVVHFLRKLGV